MDGKQVNSNPVVNDWTQTIITSIPSDARVIAVSVTNIQMTGGFRAATSDGKIVTDGSWKCSETFAEGWPNIDFDDSLWAAPTMNGKSGLCGGFITTAKWLWTDKNYNTITTIYCRKTLG